VTTADPTRIVDLAIGYMGSKQLFAASRIGLFAALADGDKDAGELAAATGVSERIARILADGMSSKGLLIRTAGRYALDPDARAYLAGASAELDLAPFLTFLDQISYPHWLQFGHTVDTTEPGDLGMDEARWGTFMAGVMTYNGLHAAMFADAVDTAGRSRLLDLGGLAPYFSLEVMKKNPALHTTFAFAPDFADSVRQAVTDAGVADRAEVVAAETATARIEGPFDLVFANHVIHRFTAEENAGIFRNARASASAGARLVVLDFFLDDDPQQRSIDALHAAEYLVIDGTVVYPESEVRGWLEAAGWKPTGVVALPGSPRVLLAEAV
jgi:hypothetical protein